MHIHITKFVATIDAQMKNKVQLVNRSMYDMFKFTRLPCSTGTMTRNY